MAVKTVSVTAAVQLGDVLQLKEVMAATHQTNRGLSAALFSLFHHSQRGGRAA